MKRNWLFVWIAAVFLPLVACTSSSSPDASQLAAPAPAATNVSADPLTGTWSGDWGPTPQHRNNVTLQLTRNGDVLNGMLNPGPSPIPLSKTSFDAGTGAIMMEAEAKGHDGVMLHYKIEGKVDGNTMRGTWAHEKQKGDFKISKIS
jgi:hypothetical protein